MSTGSPTMSSPKRSFASQSRNCHQGEHRATLILPVHLEPDEGLEDLYEPRDTTVEMELSYEVFWANPVELYCARADQLLSTDIGFDADLFIEAGVEALSDEQLAGVETAHSEFRASSPSGDINPGPFFDAIEEICDVTYREGWRTFAN